MPTTNPVPSQDPSDLLFNAGKLDEVLNGTGNSFTDRLGVARRTVAGMNSDFDAQLADAESDLNVYRADAAASAAEALGYLQTIRATSYGAYASDPATDPLGNPPTVGDEYFNTTANLLKRWNGTTWQASDINTANLAASSGSSLVGHGNGTVQDVLRNMQVQSVANLVAIPVAVISNNAQVSVKEYHAGTGLGGGNFYWDAASTEAADNGLIFAVPGVATGRFKRLLNGYISTDHYGLIDGYMLSPADTAKTLMMVFENASSRGITAVVEANEYVVDQYAGAPLASAILWIPSNIEIHWKPGSLIKRASYGATAGGTIRVVNCANRVNQSFYGILKIDGAGDTASWYVEHNHCFFIYNTKNFYAECIDAYNAMGDCLSMSGAGPSSYSENITVDRIIAKKARRKCLVLETMKGFTFGHVKLDNSELHANGSHTNCLDYEPLGVIDGDTYPVYGGHIKYLRMFGGFDGTHGTAEEVNDKFPIDIDVMHIELPPTWITTPFLAYGINIKIGRLIIDASTSGMTTETMFRLLYAPKVVIESVQIKIPAAYTGWTMSIQASGAGIPSVEIGDAKVSGDGSMIFQIQGAVFNCGTLEIQGNATNGSIARIESSSNSSEHRVSIDRLYATNVKGSYFISHRITFNYFYAQLCKVGLISLIDTTGALHPDAVVLFYTSGNDSLQIGGITAHGFTPVPYVNGAGQVGWHRTAGGVGSLSEFVMFGATPEGVIPAKLGSTARCTNGAIFQKKTGDGLNTGWV